MHSSNETTVEKNTPKLNKKDIFAWVRVVIFVGLLAIFSAAMNWTFIPPSYARMILHTLNHSEDNYDCIILGASHGRTAYDPYVLDEEWNVNAINMCIPNETVEDSYYLLKESCRNNDIKKVILDIDYQYWYKLKLNDYNSIFIYDQMEVSPVKMEYIGKHLMSRDFRVTLTRWAEYYMYQYPNVNTIVETKTSAGYLDYDVNAVNNSDADGPYMGKGFFYRNDPVEGLGAKGDLVKVRFKPEDVEKDALRYYKKIVKYCKKNNIELYCVTSPITPATVCYGQYGTVHDYFEQLCAENDVKFYDFNLVKQDVLHVQNKDYADYDGHMAGRMTKEFTKTCAKVLADDYANKNQYLYTDFTTFHDSIETVVMVDVDIDEEKVSDKEYKVRLRTKAAGGLGVVPEYKVEIIDSNHRDEKVVSTEYTSERKYSYDLPEGAYKLMVYVRNRDSQEEVKYDEYYTKNLVLNPEAYEKFKVQKAAVRAKIAQLENT